MSNRKIGYVQVWLDNVFRENSRCEQTLVQYKHMFKRFLGFLEKTAVDIVSEYETAERELHVRRKYGRLIRAFASYLQHNEDYAPATIAKYIACVKSFFTYSDLPLPKIGLGKRIVVFGNRDIKREEIKAILQNTKFLRDKAFFMMMAQSGLRPHELCSLMMRDIEHSLDNVNQNCYLVQIPQQIAKGKFHEFFTFIPHETMKTLRDYWSTRSDPLSEKSYIFIKERGDEAAPTNGGAMSQAFKKIAEKLNRAGLIQYELRKGKPSQLRLYNLRKWFRNKAYQAGSDFVNFWLGHTNLDLEHYFSKDVNVHREVYEEKALPHLQLETETPSETTKIMAKQAEEIERLKARLENVDRTARLVEQQQLMIRKLQDDLAQNKLKDVKVAEKGDALEKLLERIEALEEKLAEKDQG